MVLGEASLFPFAVWGLVAFTGELYHMPAAGVVPVIPRVSTPLKPTDEMTPVLQISRDGTLSQPQLSPAVLAE